MIFEDAIGFLCDARHCLVKFTSLVPDDITGAYLELLDAGWTVRTPAGRRHHYCPDHADYDKETQS